MSGSGIRWRWAICKSAPWSRQITTPAPHPQLSFFTGRMSFLPPNQQCQSTNKPHQFCLHKCSVVSLILTLNFSLEPQLHSLINHLENGRCSWPDILWMYFSQFLEPCDQLDGGLFRLVFLCSSWNHAGVSMLAYFTTAVDFTWFTETTSCWFCNHTQQISRTMHFHLNAITDIRLSTPSPVLHPSESLSVNAAKSYLWCGLVRSTHHFHITYAWPLCANMSSIKPEVHKVLQHCQSQATATGDMLQKFDKFSLWILRKANRLIDKHTDRQNDNTSLPFRGQEMSTVSQKYNKCCTLYTTEHFWLSLLSSKQQSHLRCCLVEQTRKCTVGNDIQYTGWVKKPHTTLAAIILSNFNQFSKFFHRKIP